MVCNQRVLRKATLRGALIYAGGCTLVDRDVACRGMTELSRARSHTLLSVRNADVLRCVRMRSCVRARVWVLFFVRVFIKISTVRAQPLVAGRTPHALVGPNEGRNKTRVRTPPGRGILQRNPLARSPKAPPCACLCALRIVP